MPQHMKVLTIMLMSTRDYRHKKYRELEAYLPLVNLYSPSSLHSANSPVFIKKYDRHTNCLLSRSCHHCLFGVILGHAFYTYSWVHVYTSASVSAWAREYSCTHAEAEAEGAFLHTHVNIQPVWVSSSLLALICQVTCNMQHTPFLPFQHWGGNGNEGGTVVGKVLLICLTSWISTGDVGLRLSNCSFSALYRK